MAAARRGRDGVVDSGVDDPRLFEDGLTACHALTHAEQSPVLYL